MEHELCATCANAEVSDIAIFLTIRSTFAGLAYLRQDAAQQPDLSKTRLTSHKRRCRKDMENDEISCQNRSKIELRVRTDPDAPKFRQNGSRNAPWGRPGALPSALGSGHGSTRALRLAVGSPMLAPSWSQLGSWEPFRGHPWRPGCPRERSGSSLEPLGLARDLPGSARRGIRERFCSHAGA